MKREIVVNPIIEVRENGEQICRQKLEALELDDIKFIIKDHNYDPFSLLTKSQKEDREYLVEFLIKRATNLSKLGQCFRECLEKNKINK